MQGKIVTMTGSEIMEAQFPRHREIVEQLLPQGLHIFSGMSKVGKSWLLLQLCMKVAAGERFWNRRTEQGKVLYFTLEDRMDRVRERALTLRDTIPENLSVSCLAPTLTDGFAKRLREYLRSEPETNLVVIDTLQKIRMGGKESSYASDYEDISQLKDVADEKNLAIVVVQHLRKCSASDPHIMISGTTGLVGAADSSFVLVKDETFSKDAKLYVRGRDVEEQVFQLHWNDDTVEWEYVSGGKLLEEELRADDAMQAVIGYMKRAGAYCGTAMELTQCLGLSLRPNVLSGKLNRYAEELRKIGITVERSRTGQNRILHLRYDTPNSAGAA